MVPFRKHYLTLTLLNALAIPITLYLTYLHFKPEASDFCVFNDQWNCDVVNKSTFAELFGIPVAIFGLLAYLVFLIFSIRGLFRDQTNQIPYFLLAVGASTAFALYLTGVEAFYLKTYCIFCVAQQILILMELATASHLYKLSKRQNHEKTA